jgi:DNA repair protein RadC
MQQQLAFIPQPESRQSRSQLSLLSLRERPAYRAAIQPETCTIIELLAALIGGAHQLEIAQALIEKFISLRAIYNTRIEELIEVPGIGQAKAEQIKAALALGLRLTTETIDRPSINCPADAASLIQNEMALLPEEHLKVIIMDVRNRVLDIIDLYKGSVNSSQIRVGEVFQAAIKMKASAIIIAHNHPTGEISPSPDDVAVTRAIVQAGKLLDIQCLDHMIIGQAGRFVSLKERGLGFS